MTIKNLAIQAALGATIAAGALVAFSAPASAYVVCNRFGDCWHTERRFTAPGITFSWHPDDWYFHRDWDRDRDYRWRSERHEGRGYWRNGVWIQF
jgi:hypothetical protein